MTVSTNLCKKKHFHQELRDFESFLFCFFYSNLGLPSAKSLQNERLGSCPAGNHPQNGFLSDGYEHNLSGKHVFDRS